jgi:hypothetical protein
MDAVQLATVRTLKAEERGNPFAENDGVEFTDDDEST